MLGYLVNTVSLLLLLRVDPNQIGSLPNNASDVRQIGNFRTEDLALKVKTHEEKMAALAIIERALENVRE